MNGSTGTSAARGPLGAQYPRWECHDGGRHAFVSSTSSSNGLGDPEHPDWGGWGGRYELYTPRMQKVVPPTRDAPDLD